MKTKLNSLSRFTDSLTYLYVEHCSLVQHQNSIASIKKNLQVHIPCANLNLLLIGPGTTITHKAIQTLAAADCMILWCGEHGVRFYAEGLGRSRSARNIIYQAKIVSNEQYRLSVVRNMYQYRFEEDLDPSLSLAQIRGKEGFRVRQAYRNASKKFGVKWEGRRYNPKEWKEADPVNRAISTANYCMYGLCHAAIIALGYSPALGFIHTGLSLSFVYDIADLFKTEYTIPLAFELAAQSPTQIERKTRYALRNLFYRTKFLNKIVQALREVLKIPELEDSPELSEFQELFDMNITQTVIPTSSDLLSVNTSYFDPQKPPIPMTQNFSEAAVSFRKETPNSAAFPTKESIKGEKKLIDTDESHHSTNGFACPLWDPMEGTISGGKNYQEQENHEKVENTSTMMPEEFPQKPHGSTSKEDETPMKKLKLRKKQKKIKNDKSQQTSEE